MDIKNKLTPRNIVIVLVILAIVLYILYVNNYKNENFNTIPSRKSLIPSRRNQVPSKFQDTTAPQNKYVMVDENGNLVMSNISPDSLSKNTIQAVSKIISSGQSSTMIDMDNLVFYVNANNQYIISAKNTEFKYYFTANQYHAPGWGSVPDVLHSSNADYYLASVRNQSTFADRWGSADGHRLNMDLWDKTNNRCYRITCISIPDNKHIVTIERLFPISLS